MNKPEAVEYYNLDRAAEILAVAPAEVNRLRETGKLRAFRDGANWKFRRGDIETCLAERIRGRNSTTDSSDEGNEESDVASQVVFDPVGDVDLPSESELVKVNAGQNSDSEPDDFEISKYADSAKGANGFDLAVQIADDEFKLADEEGGTSVLSLAGFDGKLPDEKASLPSESSASSLVPLAEDSDPFTVSNESVIDLAEIDGSAPREDSPVQGQSAGAGSHTLGLALASTFETNESSKNAEKKDEPVEVTFSIAKDTDDSDFADESSVLTLSKASDDSSAVVLTPSKSLLDGSTASDSDGFDLEPVAAGLQDDNSESSSQVIAVDAGFTTSLTNDNPFGFEEVGFTPEFGNVDAFDGGSSSTSDPFGTSATGEFASISSPSGFAKTSEFEYSNGALTAIIIAAAVMVLPGLMLIDMIAGMWSWKEPFVLNSVIMNTVAGWFGLV